MIQIGRWDDGSAYKVFDIKGKVVMTSADDKEQGGESHVKNFCKSVKTR